MYYIKIIAFDLGERVLFVSFSSRGFYDVPRVSISGFERHLGLAQMALISCDNFLGLVWSTGRERGMWKTYSRVILFRVAESNAFKMAKSLKASVDKFPWIEGIRFSEYLKQFMELYGKINSMFYSSRIHFTVGIASNILGNDQDFYVPDHLLSLYKKIHFWPFNLCKVFSLKHARLGYETYLSDRERMPRR